MLAEQGCTSGEHDSVPVIRAMKIVHYLNHTRRANGHVSVAVDLACAQAERHDVSMVSAPGDFDDCLARHRVSVIHVADASGPTRLPRMAAALVPVLHRIRPQIVNAHMVAAAVVARAVRPLFDFRIVTTVHNSFDRQAWLMNVGDRVIGVSDAVSAEMSRRGIPKGKLRTVPNGTIGGARSPLIPADVEKLWHPAVVTVCGLHARKGVRHLIEAFDGARALIPSAHLYIVGEGPERAALEAQALASASRDHIHFLGFRPDPRVVLASAEVFALASLRDPYPLVVLEARQMGSAIIASAVDGIPQALDHGRRGMLVPPGDVRSLREGLVRLLSDERLRRRFAVAAVEEIEELHVARMAARTLEVYVDALAPGSRRARTRASAPSPERA